MKNSEESLISRIWKSVRRAVGYKEVVQKESINVRTLNELAITTSSIKIEILTHDEPRIDMILDTYESGPILSINQRSDSVEIKAQKIGGTSISFFRTIPPCHLKVIVPNDIANLWRLRTASAKVTVSNLVADTIHMGTNSGSIQVKDIKANQVDVKASSGRIKATNFTVDKFRFSASSGVVAIDTVYGDVQGGANSGSITLKNIHGDKLDVKASSGSIRLQEVYVDHASARASSGNVALVRCRIKNLETYISSGNLKIDQCLGNVKGTSTSGNVNLTLTNGNSIDFKAHSGNITVHADSKQLNTALDIQSRSGQIITNIPIKFDHKSNRGMSGSIGKGENQIHLQTNSGNIRLQEIG
ncbi:DUF4097 family beta strand repeat-containing protein [Ornithinibacillus caprae]|nr:DUF4097 family beta strand repeat-containing protein [Ornithinibacillus caprae]